MSQEEMRDKELLKVEFEGLSNDDKKALRAYDQVVTKSLAILEGKPLRLTSKVPGDRVSEAVQEMIQEDSKELMEEFKAGLRTILKKKAELDQSIKQKTVEFNKAVIAKKKEFTKEANAVLSKVDEIHKIEAKYMQALGQGVQLVPAPDEAKEEDEEDKN